MTNPYVKKLQTRLKVAMTTLEQIATLPRGGRAKRLAVSTLAFLAEKPPKRYPRQACPVCGVSCSVSNHGIRAHHHRGAWCKGSWQFQESNPCQHDTLDHGICLDCGADCSDRLRAKNEARADSAKDR